MSSEELTLKPIAWEDPMATGLLPTDDGFGSQQSPQDAARDCADLPLGTGRFNVSTPPESPMNRVVLREPSQTSPSLAPSVVVVRGVAYSPENLEAMATQLSEARKTGGFPRTMSNPFDSHAIVEDFEMLQQLREVRDHQQQQQQDIADRGETWNVLWIEATRKIRDRDALLMDDERAAEASRRVQSYLQSVNMERQMYDRAASDRSREGCMDVGAGALQRRDNHDLVPLQSRFEEMGDELCSIVESAVEENMANATGPLRMNVNRFKRSVGMHSQALDNLQQQMQMQMQCQNATLGAQISALNKLCQPQVQALQSTTDNLILSNDMVNNLAQLVTNLPQVINEAVEQAFKEQAQQMVRDNPTIRGHPPGHPPRQDHHVPSHNRQTEHMDIDVDTGGKIAWQQEIGETQPRRSLGDTFKGVFMGGKKKKRSARRGRNH